MARPLDQPDRTARAKPFGGSDANRFPTFELGNRASLLQATIGGVSRCVALVGIHPLPPYWPADGRIDSLTLPQPLSSGSSTSSFGRRSPVPPSRVPGLFENNHVALSGQSRRQSNRCVGFHFSLSRSSSPIGTLPCSRVVRKQSRGSCWPLFRLAGQSRRHSIRYVCFPPPPSLSIPLPNRDPPAFPFRSGTITWPPPATLSIGRPIATPIKQVRRFPVFHPSPPITALPGSPASPLRSKMTSWRSPAAVLIG